VIGVWYWVYGCHSQCPGVLGETTHCPSHDSTVTGVKTGKVSMIVTTLVGTSVLGTKITVVGIAVVGIFVGTTWMVVGIVTVFGSSVIWIGITVVGMLTEVGSQTSVGGTY